MEQWQRFPLPLDALGHFNLTVTSLYLKISTRYFDCSDYFEMYTQTR